MLSEQDKRFFEEHGYVVARGLFSAEEAAAYREHFMTIRQQKNFPTDQPKIYNNESDPLKRYPRLMQMHRWDDTSLNWMIDRRINHSLTLLLGREPYAVQTMIYYKPAGSRGQALHQDNFYLKAQPGTCMAAWMALDPCDEENGCLQVVPGSHTWPILCTEKADTTVSFTDVTVPIPPGSEVKPVIMEPGDVLFFNGALVHGSYPNTSKDRFRRALIGHYVEGVAEQVAKYYQPVVKMDGTELTIEEAQGGGTCGVWVERDGELVPELVGVQTITRKHE